MGKRNRLRLAAFPLVACAISWGGCAVKASSVPKAGRGSVLGGSGDRALVRPVTLSEALEAVSLEVSGKGEASLAFRYSDPSLVDASGRLKSVAGPELLGVLEKNHASLVASLGDEYQAEVDCLAAKGSPCDESRVSIIKRSGDLKGEARLSQKLHSGLSLYVEKAGEGASGAGDSTLNFWRELTDPVNHERRIDATISELAESNRTLLRIRVDFQAKPGKFDSKVIFIEGSLGADTELSLIRRQVVDGKSSEDRAVATASVSISQEPAFKLAVKLKDPVAQGLASIMVWSRAN